VLVCANCHGEIEAGLIPSPPPCAKFGEDWEPVQLEPTEPEVVQLDSFAQPSLLDGDL